MCSCAYGSNVTNTSLSVMFATVQTIASAKGSVYTEPMQQQIIWLCTNTNWRATYHVQVVIVLVGNVAFKGY